MKSDIRSDLSSDRSRSQTAPAGASRTVSSHRFCDRYADRGVAVRDGDADVEFGNLTVEVPRHEPLIWDIDIMESWRNFGD